MREGKAYRQAEADRVEAKKNQIEAQGANMQLQMMLRGPKGAIKPPPGWEWAEKLKTEQEAVNGRR